MPIADTATRIEAFVRVQFSVDRGDLRFDRHVDLFERGYIDSVGIVELLGFFEEDLGVEVPEDDLLSDEFSTIAGMAQIVERVRTGLRDNRA